MKLFILCLLFKDALNDTPQLRGFASVVLGSNAQLTMKGIPRMDGRLLIAMHLCDLNELENNHTCACVGSAQRPELS